MSNLNHSPTKNLDTVKKQNTYRKKFVLHEPENSDKDEISFDLKSVFTELLEE